MNDNTKEAAVQELRAIIDSKGNQASWDEAWAKKVTPWDAGQGPQRALISTWTNEETRRLFPPAGGNVLIPGCGRGMDVEFFAKQGFHAKGIDISEEAIHRAKHWIGSFEQTEASSRISFLSGDYFALGDISQASSLDRSLSKLIETNDAVYDYTFFCALPQELHLKWAAAHHRALRQGGILIAIVFPLRLQGDDDKIGPPYPVEPGQYQELLSPYFELEHEGVPTESDHPGRELVMIFRRK